MKADKSQKKCEKREIIELVKFEKVENKLQI